MSKLVKRRKPDAERKTLYLRVRVTEEQQELITEAAKHAGISVSAWLIERALRAARAEQKSRALD